MVDLDTNFLIVVARVANWFDDREPELTRVSAAVQIRVCHIVRVIPPRACRSRRETVPDGPNLETLDFDPMLGPGPAAHVNMYLNRTIAADNDWTPGPASRCLRTYRSEAGTPRLSSNAARLRSAGRRTVKEGQENAGLTATVAVGAPFDLEEDAGPPS
jgi:hypothetical protein